MYVLCIYIYIYICMYVYTYICEHLWNEHLWNTHGMTISIYIIKTTTRCRKSRVSRVVDDGSR